MNNPGLIMPPQMNDGMDEQFSYNGSERKSSKSIGKPKKKQTSIAIKKKIINNQSSSTYNENREADTGSVHSHGSKGSVKKGKKKQTSLKKERHVKPQSHQNMFKSFEEQEEKQEPQVMDYSPAEKSEVNGFYNPKQQSPPFQRHQRKQQKNARAYSPFHEIMDNDDEDVPVVKIKQIPNRVKTTEYVSPKGADKKEEAKRLGQMFEKSRTNEPSKRSKIFKNTTLQNQSSVSKVYEDGNQSKTVLGGQSRRSRSKLGNLLKQSRQKSQNQSKVNFDQVSSIGQLKQDSRVNKSKLMGGSKEKIVYIENKQLSDSQNFMNDFSKSDDLDLSQSHSNDRKPPNQMQIEKPIINSFNERQSLCFNFEGEKKKKGGVSVISRNKNPQEMVKIEGDNLVSKTLQYNLIKIEGDNLISKRRDSKQKLINNFKKNEEYLMNSGLLGKEKSQREEQQRKKQQQRQKQKQRQFQIQKQRQKQERQRQKQVERQRQRQRQIQIKKQRQIERQGQIQRQRVKRQKEREKELRRQRQLQLERQEQQQQRKRQEQHRQKLRRMEKKKRQQKERRERQEQQERQRQRQNERVQRQRKQRKQYERRQKEKQREQERKRQLQQKQKLVSLEHLPSTYSRDQSSNGSEKSKKKNTKKKEGVVLAKKPRTAYLGGGSPRGEQSFYEEPSEPQVQQNQAQNVLLTQSKPKERYQPKNIISFSDEENDDVVKSKTDTHFYAPSIKAPSSKPPLSRKSNSSKGKDSKVSVIKKNTPSKASQIDKNQKPKEPKKMNLIELAMQKKYEDSRSNSQCSFDSRESFSSKQSKGSKRSKNSKKESSIDMKQNTFTHFNRPPTQKLRNEQLANRTISHEKEMKKLSSQKSSRQVQEQQRVIVSKDTFFINEQGKLVNQDLIIKGNKSYGKPTKQFDESIVYNRLKRSREKRKSKSRQRSMERTQNKLKMKSRNSNQSGDQSSASSYYKNQYSVESMTPKSSNFYSSQQSYIKNEGAGGLNSLKQFIKPIQQNYSKPLNYHNDEDYSNQNTYSNFYEESERESQNISYNDMFGGKGKRKNESINYSKQKRTMKRTEKTRK